MATIQDLIEKMNSEEGSDSSVDMDKLSSAVEGAAPSIETDEEDIACAVLLEKLAAELATTVEVGGDPKGPMEEVRSEAKKVLNKKEGKDEGKHSPSTAPGTDEKMTSKGNTVVETSDETEKLAAEAYLKGVEIAEEYFEEISKQASELLEKIASDKIPVTVSAEPAPDTAPKDDLNMVGEGEGNPRDSNVSGSPESEESKKRKAAAIERLKQKILNEGVTRD